MAKLPLLPWRVRQVQLAASLFVALLISLQPLPSFSQSASSKRSQEKRMSAVHDADLDIEFDLSKLFYYNSTSSTPSNSTVDTEDDENDSANEDDASSLLDSAIYKFDAALESACNPNTQAGLFDQLQSSVSRTEVLTTAFACQHVGDALGPVDQWMGSLLGTMMDMESDPSALYDLLTGEGDIWAVLKSNSLFLLSIIAAIVVFIIYLLFCLPNLFCKYLSRPCCCKRCAICNISFMSRVLWAAVLAALAVVGIVFGSLVLNAQGRGVSGAQQLYCQTYLFAKETLRGSSSLAARTTTVQAEEEFRGLLPLIDNVTSLVELADKENPNNVLEQAKAVAIKHLDVKPLEQEMNKAFATLSTLCKAFSASVNSLPDGFHESMWCEKTAVEHPMEELVHAEKFMKLSASRITEFTPKNYADKLFDKVLLPELDIAGSFPISTVKDLFISASSALADTEETVSSMLRWLSIGLMVDCGFYVALLILVILWAAYFFCFGNKASSVTPAILWNLKTCVVFIFLLFGGVLGWLMTAGRQGCSIATKYFLEEDKWDLLTQYAPVVEPLVAQCLTKEGAGDLLVGVGVDGVFDGTINALKSTIAKFPSEIKPLDSDTSARAEKYLQAAALFGSLVVVNKNDAPEDRRNVFKEFLSSGLQVEDVELDDGKIVYGLATLERLVAPWKLPALHPDEPADGVYIIGRANPNERDSNYTKWLASKSELVLKGLEPQEAEMQAEEFKLQTKNGIWWLQQKQKLLNLEYPCELEDGKGMCNYADMFGINAPQMKTSIMYAAQLSAGRNCRFLWCSNSQGSPSL
ncbi:hypothetical protein Emag_000532 [Eimeria magna]